MSRLLTESVAHAILVAERWPDDITCVRCGSPRCVLLTDRFFIKCYGCDNVFSVRHGSVMAASKLSLFTWIIAYAQRGRILEASANATAARFNISMKTAVHFRNRLRRWPTMWRKDDNVTDRETECERDRERIARRRRARGADGGDVSLQGAFDQRS